MRIYGKVTGQILRLNSEQPVVLVFNKRGGFSGIEFLERLLRDHESVKIPQSEMDTLKGTLASGTLKGPEQKRMYRVSGLQTVTRTSAFRFMMQHVSRIDVLHPAKGLLSSIDGHDTAQQIMRDVMTPDFVQEIQSCGVGFRAIWSWLIDTTPTIKFKISF